MSSCTADSKESPVKAERRTKGRSPKFRVSEFFKRDNGTSSSGSGGTTTLQRTKRRDVFRYLA